MDALNDVKRRLKTWERDFIKESGHKPGKDDIESNQAIKDLYKQYAKLKKSSESPSVWGPQLNKSTPGQRENDSSVEDSEVKTTSFMSSLSQKLRERGATSSSKHHKKPDWKILHDTAVQNLPPAHGKSYQPLKEEEPVFTGFSSSKSWTDSKESSMTVVDKLSSKPGDMPLIRTAAPSKETYCRSSFMKRASNLAGKVALSLSEPSQIPDKMEESVSGIPSPESSVGSAEKKENRTATCRSHSDPSFDGNKMMYKSQEVDEAPSRRHKRKAAEMEDLEPSDGETRDGEVQWQTDPPPDEVLADLDQESSMEEASSTSRTYRKPVPTKNRPISNDNFVRLNMKVRRYRGKGKMSGSAHRRMAWKQKMARRSEAHKGTCFKCGGEGHWAKECKGKGKIDWSCGSDAKKAKLAGEKLQESQPVNDADFPSLRAAAQMARGIKPSTVSRAKGDSAEGNNDEDENEIEVIRTAYTPPPPPPPAKPLYNLCQDGSLPVTPNDVHDALHRFGFPSFRPGQEEAIMRILCGQSTLVMLSTGAGKSLCYQLPAYLYAKHCKCITLVISPLVSLMEDQVSGLPPGVRGACLHTNMTKNQKDAILEGVSNGSYHFLLVSPEAVIGGSVRVDKLPTIAFACVDEVHCVSEWSHHFRPSYLRLCKVLKEQYGVQCMLGLTATATMVTAASVAQHLGIKDYHTATIRGSPVPGNLCLSVSRDEDKDEALVGLLQGDRFSSCDSIIVYCTRRQLTDRVATLLRTNLQDVKPPKQPEETENKKKKGKKAPKKAAMIAECYHAGLTPAQRKRVQNAFMSGRLRIIVATVAFGMGLDKPDVRGVVHYNLPKTFESYVQEIGRAGRDGKLAHCHVFLDAGDLNELRRHVHANVVDPLSIKHLIRTVFPPCKCQEIHKRHQDAREECAIGDEELIEMAEIVEKGESADDQSNSTSGQGLDHKERLCAGHERAIPIEELVAKLDMKEEGIATLLCYLELHPKRWLENLQNVYATCRIQCYGGPQQLLAIAKKNPPVAVAVAQARLRGVSMSHSNQMEFNVVGVADSMGWESGPVKRELKMLQWEFGVSGPRKTGVMVEFSDLSFHVRSPGDLSEEETDEIMGFLSERMLTQEHTELSQLQSFFDILCSVSHKSCWMCADKADEVRSEKLKSSISDYFERQLDLDDGHVTMLSFASESTRDENLAFLDSKITCDNEASIRGDIRNFINLYRSEHSLTGRSIARVFHGIGSPNFPAEVWGKVRRFWRSHLAVDFNVLRRMATQELVYMK